MAESTSAVANILVADDTLENLRLLFTTLGSEGYEVRPVTGGRQALAAAERDPPDLILLDIDMPEMDGYQVCSELAARPALAHIPVLFHTALSDVSSKVRAFEVGGVDYITKPFQLDEVRARVRTHLTLRRAKRDLEQSLERLSRLEQLRDDLVHMIVHDMRSPLMALSGHLSFVQEEAAVSLSKESLDDLDAAARAARLVAGMANDLVDVSRLEANQVKLELLEHDLRELILGVLRALGKLDPGRVIELQLSEPLLAACDAGLIRRVLENLVGNAIKHTPSSGRVTIGACSMNSLIRVTVSDEGPGIPAEARQRIFEKFGTVAARRDQQYHSVGLGLAFCKLAMAAHGGSVGVNPREPSGSVFWFDLPRRGAQLV